MPMRAPFFAAINPQGRASSRDTQYPKVPHDVDPGVPSKRRPLAADDFQPDSRGGAGDGGPRMGDPPRVREQVARGREARFLGVAEQWRRAEAVLGLGLGLGLGSGLGLG